MNYYKFAGLAQLVEQLICNQWVGGSNPSSGTIPKSDHTTFALTFFQLTLLLKITLLTFIL